MHFFKSLIVGVAAFSAMPSFAAEPIGPKTIVQRDSLITDRGFAYFDSSLGILQSVRLDITPDFRRGFQIFMPGNVSSVDISWDASSEQFCRYSCVNLSASGSATLPLVYSATLLGGSSYAYIPIDFSGPTITTYLDTANFINPPFQDFRKWLAAPDPGLYDESLADIFTVPGGGFARNANIVYGCRNSISGCDRSMYQLTYSYAPGGVPEPKTWLMMMLGFGGMGFALRRRQKVTTRVRFA